MVDVKLDTAVRSTLSLLFSGIGSLNETVLDESAFRLFDSEEPQTYLLKSSCDFYIREIGFIYAMLIYGRTHEEFNISRIFYTERFWQSRISGFSSYGLNGYKKEDLVYLPKEYNESEWGDFLSTIRKNFVQIKRYNDMLLPMTVALTNEDRKVIGHVVSHYGDIIKILQLDRRIDIEFYNMLRRFIMVFCNEHFIEYEDGEAQMAEFMQTAFDENSDMIFVE